MSPIALALALYILGAAALVALFAIFRGPDTGPGGHRWTPQHRAADRPAPAIGRAALPFIEHHRPTPSTWKPYILDDEPHGSTVADLIDHMTRDRLPVT